MLLDRFHLGQAIFPNPRGPGRAERGMKKLTRIREGAERSSIFSPRVGACGHAPKGLTMNLEKYTERARGFVQAAQSLALREGHQQFTPEHVLKVLLDDEEGLAAGLIDRAGGNSRQALTEVEAALAKLPKVEGSGAGQLYMAPTTARLFDNAEKIAQKAGDSFVTVERLLLALAMEKGAQAAKILANAGVSAQTLNAAINDIRKGRTADSASAENHMTR